MNFLHTVKIIVNPEKLLKMRLIYVPEIRLGINLRISSKPLMSFLTDKPPPAA